MATDILAQSLGSIVPTSDGLLAFAYLFGGLILFAILIFGFVFSKAYKHTLIIRHVLGKKQGAVETIKCREYTDESGIAYWAPFFKPRIPHAPAPPSEYRTLTTQGKWFAEALFDGGTYQWITPDFQEEIETEREILTKEGTKEKEKVKKFDVFRGTQRWAYLNRIKAAMKKRENWKMMLFPIAGMSMTLLALLLLVVFYDDATDKPIEMQKLANEGIGTMERIMNQNAEVAQQNAKILEILAQVLGDPEVQAKVRQQLPEQPPG